MKDEAEIIIEVERNQDWLFRWSATVIVQEPGKTRRRVTVGLGFTKDNAIREARRQWKRHQDYEKWLRRERQVVERIPL